MIFDLFVRPVRISLINDLEASFLRLIEAYSRVSNDRRFSLFLLLFCDEVF